MISEEMITFLTHDGVVLEARLGVPKDVMIGLVICHPHPLYGGDMENPVVVRAAEVARGLGLATLRFNFRGVGRSQGRYDGGQGEQLDVESALSYVREAIGGAPAVALAGYSFGAAVAAQVAARSNTLAGLALIAPPLELEGFERLPDLATLREPLLIVAGDADQYCPVAALNALRDNLPHAMVRSIPGADHFFFGKLFPLGQIVAEWLSRLRAGETGRRRGAG